MTVKDIQILGLTYEVEEVPVIDKDCHLAGQILYEKQCIKIDESLRPDRKGQVLMHEILHGILEQLGEDELNEDESKVQALAMSLHQTLSPYLTISFESKGEK